MPLRPRHRASLPLPTNPLSTPGRDRVLRRRRSSPRLRNGAGESLGALERTQGRRGYGDEMQMLVASRAHTQAEIG